jgi:flagellar assembly protein FliH
MRRRVIKSSETDTRTISDFQRDTLEQLLAGSDLNGLQPEDILAVARQEAESKVQEAYNEGLRRGLEEGRRRFQQSVAEAGAALQEAAVAMQAARERFLDALEPEVVSLAFALAERILQREAKTDRELVLSTARAALLHLVGGERVVVRVNPQDLEAMRAQKIALLEEFQGLQQLDIVADEHVAPGGCLADSEFSHVDARIGSQLHNLLDSFQEPQ